MTSPLFLDGVDVWYGDLQAVRGVSLEVPAGKVVGLIGETGSGKTSLVLAAARLLPPTARIGGRILLDGIDITAMNRPELRHHRGTRLAFISQDSMAALNPVLRIGWQVGEMFEVHQDLSRARAMKEAISALEMVRIPEPRAVAKLYPHQLSGGMRQRVMIAMALALKPHLVIADEPTTGLDVSVQAEILSLVLGLRDRLGSSILWISHDMGVIAELADDVAVMYAGRLVEYGTAHDLFDGPGHPYTHALLSTLQDLRGGAPGKRLYQISGQPPSLQSPVPGCPFHPRCPRAKGMCEEAEPELVRARASQVACHFPMAMVATEASG